MNIFTIIILFFLIPSLVVILFLLLKIQRNRCIRNGLRKAADQLIIQNDLLVRTIHYLRDKVIGIDKKNKKLIFAHFKKGVTNQLCVDLKSISSCIVSKTIDPYSKYETNIFLHLQLRSQYETLRLNFYDRSLDSTGAKSTLLEKARYWKHQINLNRKAENQDHR